MSLFHYTIREIGRGMEENERDKRKEEKKKTT